MRQTRLPLGDQSDDSAMVALNEQEALDILREALAGGSGRMSGAASAGLAAIAAEVVLDRLALAGLAVVRVRAGP